LTASKTNLFIDFDGTIISSKERCGRVFCDLLGLPPTSFLENYIHQRDSGKTNSDIIASQGLIDQESVDDFHRMWMRTIELPEYLAIDTVLGGAREWLEAHKDNHNLYLCTNRQDKLGTMTQVKMLDLASFFQEVLITEQKLSKAQLISSSVQNVSSLDWIIGDSPEDIRDGKKLGLRTCAVLTGFSGRQSLIAEAPDLIVDSIDCVSLVRRN
jgi:phosphoglycolate phosphatase